MRVYHIIIRQSDEDTLHASCLGGNEMSPASTPKIHRKRLGEELTTELRRHITEKGLRPGDSLLTEQEMMAKFGVSRSVVREATKALDFLGIIDAVPSRGMVLDEFDFDRVTEYFGFHFALSNFPKEQLLRTRVVIETGSLFYVAEAMKKDPGVYAALGTCAERGAKPWRERRRAVHRIRYCFPPCVGGRQRHRSVGVVLRIA